MPPKKYLKKKQRKVKRRITVGTRKVPAATAQANAIVNIIGSGYGSMESGLGSGHVAGPAGPSHPHGLIRTRAEILAGLPPAPAPQIRPQASVVAFEAERLLRRRAEARARPPTSSESESAVEILGTAPRPTAAAEAQAARRLRERESAREAQVSAAAASAATNPNLP